MRKDPQQGQIPRNYRPHMSEHHLEASIWYTDSAPLVDTGMPEAI